jgi:glutamine amidotransferase-like uncharacterized protein
LKGALVTGQRRVLIYADDGAGERSQSEVAASLAEELDSDKLVIDLISGMEVRTSSWEEGTAAVVMPGGADLPYDAKLRGLGNERIRDYVRGGGRYLGFCAGAYYGSAYIEFDKGQPLEICGDRELGFFPGTAVGPIYGPGTYDYDSEEGARAARILLPEMGSAPIPIYFNGGCAFPEASRMTPVKVLGSYEDIPGTPPAIILCSVGDGYALLSGVHPEFRFATLEAGDSRNESVVNVLRTVESSRRMVFRYLLDSVGLPRVEHRLKPGAG